MTPNWRLIKELTPGDLATHPVWEFVNDDPEAPDTAVRPVASLPVDDLTGRLVGTRLRLHGGSSCWAFLSNISLQSPRRTKHFLCIGVERNGCWFDLARYHDVDFARRGPAAMAEFLGLPVQDVFPLEYDISAVALGNPGSVRGLVKAEPDEKLTEDELINLTLTGE